MIAYLKKIYQFQQGRKHENVIYLSGPCGYTRNFCIYKPIQDFEQITASLQKISAPYLILAVVLALFFFCMDGTMILYLLGALDRRRSGLLRRISYSFIGFFYSKITPSATSGQPMQLYHMNKDKNTLADSSVVLMKAAIIYKFMLAIIIAPNWMKGIVSKVAFLVLLTF